MHFLDAGIRKAKPGGHFKIPVAPRASQADPGTRHVKIGVDSNILAAHFHHASATARKSLMEFPLLDVLGN